MDFITRYRQPSLVENQAGLLLIFLASTEQAEQPATLPAIFSGQIAQPLMFRNLLLGFAADGGIALLPA